MLEDTEEALLSEELELGEARPMRAEYDVVVYAGDEDEEGVEEVEEDDDDGSTWAGVKGVRMDREVEAELDMAVGGLQRRAV